MRQYQQLQHPLQSFRLCRYPSRLGEKQQELDERDDERHAMNEIVGTRLLLRPLDSLWLLHFVLSKGKMDNECIR